MARSSKKLTKRTVDAAKPSGARFIIWDTELSGFGLRVEPSGTKVFVARYRAGGGRAGTLRQATIGRYGNITTDEARGKAKQLLGKAAGGGDPVGAAKAARQAGITVAEVCDWYMKEARAGRLLGRRGRPIAASTLASDEGRITIHVKPLIGRRPVASLTPRDMEQMQADIAAARSIPAPDADAKRKRGGLARGGGGVGGRTLAMMNAVFGHAIRHQLITNNPARGARKVATTRRTDRLSLDELRALGGAMRTEASRTGAAAVRLIAMTGLRREEALSLTPGALLREGGLDLPRTKTGPQRRPAGRGALDTIAAEMERHGSPAWVFPADHGDGHFIGLPKVLARLCKAAGVRTITPHVLRHTFASIAAEIGYSELIVAGLLGHAAGSVTSGYVHLDRSLVAAADRVADVIAGALDGREAATVTPIRQGALS
jgi:integrase